MEELNFMLCIPPEKSEYIVDINSGNFWFGEMERQDGKIVLDVYNHPKKKDWQVDLESFWKIYEEYKDRLALYDCNDNSQLSEDTLKALAEIEADSLSEQEKVDRFEYELGFPLRKEECAVDVLSGNFIFGKIKQKKRRLILAIDHHPQKDGWRIDLETLFRVYEEYKSSLTSHYCEDESQLKADAPSFLHDGKEEGSFEKQSLINRIFKK